MNEAQAGRIADRLLQRHPEGLRNGREIDAQTMQAIDRDGDGQATRQEIVSALVADRVSYAAGRISAVEPVSLDLPSASEPPVAGPNALGLRGRPWFRPEAVPPGGTGPAPVGVRGAGATLGDGQRAATLTDHQIDALKGQAFGDVATALSTPEDVALFLDRAITYDNGRTNGGGNGPAGSYSAVELLELGTGVCRDYHALSRALLQENGYPSSLLGYSASGQGHAVTAYQDPETGYWGILEYGNLFPPDQLQAGTPEEALMMVRPSALEIRTYGDGGPEARSNTAERIFYTPTYRVYEDFMAGPSRDAGTGIQATNRSTNLTLSSNDRNWQGRVQINHDPRLPHLQGSVMAGAWHSFGDSGFRVGIGGGYVPHNTTNIVGSNKPVEHAQGFVFAAVEEYHPELLQVRDIGGSGIDLTVGSHARAQGTLAFGRPEYGMRDTDGDGTEEFVERPEGIEVDAQTTGALSNLKWNPSLTLSREFGPARVHAGYGLGIDAALMGRHYGSGGSGFPVSQYVTGGVDAQATDWLRLSAEGYVPITNVSNDFAASPALRLEASTPYASLGTTQSADFGRYDISTGVTIQGVTIGAFTAVDEDRQTGRTGVSVGGQLSIVNF